MNCGLRANVLARKLQLNTVGSISWRCHRAIHSLNGIFPPIVVPFDQTPQQKIAYKHLEKNFEKWNSVPFAGYVVHGSNGEFVNLTREEKVELINVARKFTAPPKLLIAGVGCESTLSTLETAEAMAQAGADAALVVTPSYYRQHLSDRALHNYYKEVADSSPLPVIMYNVPANTGVDLNADFVVGLSTHPNIIGLKDSSGDVTKLASIISRTKKSNFQVLAGSASFLLPAYNIGCVGGICALANVLGSAVTQLHDTYTRGDKEAALQLQYRLIDPNIAVTKKYGVAGLKSAMDWKGFYGGVPRRPLLPLTDADAQKLRETFESNGF